MFSHDVVLLALALMITGLSVAFETEKDIDNVMNTDVPSSFAVNTNNELEMSYDEKDSRSKTSENGNASKQKFSKEHQKLKESPIFPLHPPDLQSEVEEFVFSPWYFLVFSVF